MCCSLVCNELFLGAYGVNKNPSASLNFTFVLSYHSVLFSFAQGVHMCILLSSAPNYFSSYYLICKPLYFISPETSFVNKLVLSVDISFVCPQAILGSWGELGA